MKNTRVRIVAALLLILVSGSLAAQTGSLTDFTAPLLKRVKIGGFFNGGYDWISGGDAKTSTFYVKDAVVRAEGPITSRWSFKLEYNLAKPKLRDIWLDYAITSWLHVRAGQMRKAFGIESDIAPDMADVVDLYSPSTSYIVGLVGDPLYDAYSGRDIGIKLWGDIPGLPLDYQLAVMNGEGDKGRDKNLEKDFMGKLTFRASQSLGIVGSFYLGRGHLEDQTSGTPSFEAFNYARRRFGLGAQYRSGGTRIHGEMLLGKAGTWKTWGSYVTLAFPLYRSLEAVASVDYMRITEEDHFSNLCLIAGLQYWFFDSCRLQVQYTGNNSRYLDDSGRLKVQFQVGF